MNPRFELIKEYIRNKNVLDIGCCDSEEIVESDNWLHSYIKKHAKSVIGIDISRNCIELLKQKGYAVEYADAENFDLNRKFDVVVAGELIEHLSNFEGFLNCVKKHLVGDGLLIISTPNVFYYLNTLFVILRGYPSLHPEHTCWFDELTIKQLLFRFGFFIDKLIYTNRKEYRPKSFKDLILKFFEYILPWKKLKFDTIVVIARLNQERNYE